MTSTKPRLAALHADKPGSQYTASARPCAETLACDDGCIVDRQLLNTTKQPNHGTVRTHWTVILSNTRSEGCRVTAVLALTGMSDPCTVSWKAKTRSNVSLRSSATPHRRSMSYSSIRAFGQRKISYIIGLTGHQCTCRCFRFPS